MNIYTAISNVMSEIGAISKGKTNLQQNFKYRGVDDVMNVLQPLLVKHRVFIVPEVLEQIREDRTSSKGNALIYSVCKIKYTFYADDSSSIVAVVIGEGMDSGDKATNKAMAIAFKYVCFQVFCIPTEEMKDPDEEVHELANKKTQQGNKPAGNTQGKPESTEAKHICEDCSKEVTATTQKTVEQILSGSQKFYQKVLCQACVSKRYKAEHPEANK